ncbi:MULTISPECIES: chromate resistance protein ChrB domain-containing protein [Haematobacter]|uniref:Sulfurtransferase n=2 Tax=Haematobacter TaxID=366614 RepID=A0A086XTZ8_9RHOB|nr:MULTISPECIES: sulfurtransferase/chromate resistance protein [Haematobacter]KFI25498.1 sulfurtransferase [Haematobacter massiliensis]OWJ69555.1 sulfurtransferase [Haematobacter massiliensis]OWJ74975.1 sulfurtransferase [Haematobacter genomosp. 1]OWJ85726.1 sulfurtransferase [Haematobacter massiliensis]
MPAPDAMTCEKLSKLIGTPKAPVVLDVRRDALRNADPRLIATARAVPETGLVREALSHLARELRGEAPGRPVLVVCAEGHGRSQGVAAWLRHEGLAAEYLEGGHAAWVAGGLPTFDPAKLPRPDGAGRSLWVTRSRPKIDRIACPWLIRRFIDPRAVFLYVTPSEVQAVAETFGAAPYDIDGVFWSHRGETCTFDTLIAEFDLSIPALDRLATIVRGADTARPDLAPECAGLIAASLGLSRMHVADLEQLEAGMALYDAFYRWCRDATGETHTWQSHGKSAK